MTISRNLDEGISGFWYTNTQPRTATSPREDYTNNVTLQVLQAFEQANNQAQAILAKSKVQETEIQQ